ncbi:conjugal transfer pilus assembly protein TraK [Pseudoduganella eburnea]|uniref:Conjugal transfer pilus assembly protein TraK n=1 Tax=Massilia eburnea TaxID=1776165 RepID=A0A6L6QD99_9BURK|nr:type-F conjugative transfer system secretin TraK [Massilia eburnea]MTW10165.1 conjugal transfer pilus assembly protein TraK [Massilia eburnea]
MNRKTLPWLVALCASAMCSAEQVRPAKDGATIEVAIAKDAPTRIRIQGDRIVDVVGNVQSSTGCDPRPPDAGAAGAVIPSTPAPVTSARGDVMLNCDLERGEVFISPVGAGDKPISLFISSARATYTLRLRRADIEADTIVIDDRSPRASSAATRPQRSASHVRAAKGMLVAMASVRPGAAYRVEDMERPIALWKEADFKLVRKVEGQDLVGELYSLTNISATPMVLAEQEFDREEGGVVAVAIEHHNLQPGDATSVFVIRSQEERP